MASLDVRLFGRPLLALLFLQLLPCRTVHLAMRHPYLVHHVVRNAVLGHTAGFLSANHSGTAAQRRLDATAKSEMKHNGTHMERNIHAKWQCTFPQGDCYKKHAPMEGLPEQMDKCTKEKALQPLEIEMTIDLKCAGVDSLVDCSRSGSSKPYDPLLLCNTDPMLLQAKCHTECRKNGKNGKVLEICVFKFDTSGTFNMSDSTVETCTLDAMCKSPYVEQNEMFCSGHNSTKKHKAHWLTEDRAWKHRETHGIEAPPASAAEVKAEAGMSWVPQALPARQHKAVLVSKVLWAAGLVLFMVAGGIHLGRSQRLPRPLQQIFEDLMDRAGNWVTFANEQQLSSPAMYRRRKVRYQAPQAPPSEIPGAAAAVKEEKQDEAVEFSAAAAAAAS